MDRIGQLITNAGKMTKEVRGWLDHIKATCMACKLDQKARPLPLTSLPRATEFNQVVTIDLKDYKDGEYNFICYLVDWHSKLTVGEQVKNKEMITIAEVILRKWCAVFGGRPDTLHSDRGKEFNNELLTLVAEYLGIRTTLTAAYSPQQNGVNERNHAVVDHMMKRMMLEDPTMSVSTALTWALVAKNTLSNVSGYSPFQLLRYKQNLRF